MRRIRLLLVAAGILAVALLGISGTASAAGEGELDHAEEKCIEQLEAGESIDEACQKAPNPLVPEIHELVWGTFGFAVVLFGMWKFAVPAMRTTLDARAERIQGDITAAEAQRSEADQILAEYQAQLADARTESARIIEEARQAADEVRSNLQAKAEADIAELRARAAADIESAKAQAITDLRSEVTALAIGAAEQVVGRNLDQETNAALVEAYIAQVGADR